MSFFLVLTVKPTVNISPRHLFGEGKDVVIRCNVKGFPKSQITWSRSEKPLPSTILYRNENQEIIVKSAKLIDSGTYKCLAQNKAGSSAGSTVLWIERRPGKQFDLSQENLLYSDLMNKRPPFHGYRSVALEIGAVANSSTYYTLLQNKRWRWCGVPSPPPPPPPPRKFLKDETGPKKLYTI